MCFVFLAHARLMFRDTVTLEDAITVVSVMESSMQVRIFCVPNFYPYYKLSFFLKKGHFINISKVIKMIIF